MHYGIEFNSHYNFRRSRPNVGNYCQQISSKMVETKKKNVYREKRKEKPFSGVQKQAKRVTKTTEIADPTPSTSRDCFDSESEMEEPISASRKKMKLESSPSDSFLESSESEDEKDAL